MSKKERAVKLFREGKRASDPEVKALGLASKTRYNYYQLYKKDAGQALPKEAEDAATATKPTLKAAMKTTTDPTKAALLRLEAQSYVIPNTPGIQTGYLCALKHGFPGDIALYLTVVSEDFWYGRGIDPYKEVSGWVGVPLPQEEV